MGSPFFPTPLPHCDWDLNGISLPPYPEGLGALYRHVIEGGRRRRGWGTWAKFLSPYPQKFGFVWKKNYLPLLQYKNGTQTRSGI